MARTTASAVEAIIEVKATVSVTPFIEVANDLVTNVCTASSYSVATLELIERWLAAHFYAIRDPRRESEEADEVAAKFKSKVELGFNVTHYGQMAMRLDTAGNLAALDSRTNKGLATAGVGITWLGNKRGELNRTEL